MLHDASGINDDWPAGRGIFIDDNHEFVVLVNFEDHIRIIMLPGQEIKKDPGSKEGPDFKTSIKRLEKLSSAFERIGYAQDPYLGNLTVSPIYLGTGMTITTEYKMQGQYRETTVDETKQLALEHNCQATVSKGYIRLETCNYLAPNYNELLVVRDFFDTVKKFNFVFYGEGNAN